MLWGWVLSIRHILVHSHSNSTFISSIEMNNIDITYANQTTNRIRFSNGWVIVKPAADGYIFAKGLKHTHNPSREKKKQDHRAAQPVSIPLLQSIVLDGIYLYPQQICIRQLLTKYRYVYFSHNDIFIFHLEKERKTTTKAYAGLMQ